MLGDIYGNTMWLIITLLLFLQKKKEKRMILLLYRKYRLNFLNLIPGMIVVSEMVAGSGLSCQASPFQKFC